MHRNVISSRGLTLVELLVVLAISALVMALILPGVQQRETAQRHRCAANLKQVGEAVLNFESSKGALPSGANGGGFSAFAQAMHYLEPTVGASIDWFVSEGNAANSTLAETQISVLLCPSDYGSSYRLGVTNYAANQSSGFQQFKGNGPFPGGHGIRLQEITDGASNTAGIAEWVVFVAGSAARPDPLGSIFDVSQDLTSPNQLDQFAAACDHVPTTFPVSPKGTDWMFGSIGDSQYNHVLPIDRHSCGDAGDLLLGAVTAGSRHPGGANVLFVDGHVRFLSETVSLSVWRALGSRNGGEVISE